MPKMHVKPPTYHRIGTIVSVAWHSYLWTSSGQWLAHVNSLRDVHLLQNLESAHLFQELVVVWTESTARNFVTTSTYKNGRNRTHTDEMLVWKIGFLFPKNIIFAALINPPFAISFSSLKFGIPQKLIMEGQYGEPGCHTGYRQ